jgi:hypothetical protein
MISSPKLNQECARWQSETATGRKAHSLATIQIAQQASQESDFIALLIDPAARGPVK